MDGTNVVRWSHHYPCKVTALFFIRNKKYDILLGKQKYKGRKRFPSNAKKELNKETKLPLTTCAYKTNVTQINVENHKMLTN